MTPTHVCLGGLNPTLKSCGLKWRTWVSSYGPPIELVTGHWSAKHRTVVEGINLITPLWTDGDISTPVDWGDLQKTHSTIGLVGDLCGLFFTSNLFR